MMACQQEIQIEDPKVLQAKNEIKQFGIAQVDRGMGFFLKSTVCFIVVNALADLSMGFYFGINPLNEISGMALIYFLCCLASFVARAMLLSSGNKTIVPRKILLQRVLLMFSIFCFYVSSQDIFYIKVKGETPLSAQEIAKAEAQFIGEHHA